MFCMSTTNAHRLARMTGRDPNEAHRAASPLELLFDLAFVLAIGAASGEFAHYVAEAHIAAALGGFGFAMFTICWAWINFTRFASAYDTDDWVYRLLTMVQVIGVVVVALGVPRLFESVDEGEHIDNRIVVIGYVIMRVAVVALWLRAARQDEPRRATALGYAKYIALAQIGWVVVAVIELDYWPTTVIAVLLFTLEAACPIFIERKEGATPWHAHHIAERYALLTIIALGEGIFGTVAAVSAIVEDSGWTVETALVIVAGVGLTFGLWWTYFLLPSGRVLARRRGRQWGWSYGHFAIFASVAATGAGLHVAAYVIEGHSELGAVGAVLSVAIPVIVFCVSLFVLYDYLVGAFDGFHVWLMAGTMAVLVLAVALAAGGASIGLCLIVVMLAPAVIVVGYETIGHRHEAAFLHSIEG